MNAAVAMPGDKIGRFCRRHHVRRLAVFGSATRDDFRPDSDVDVLVQFQPGKVPSLLGLVRMEDELSAIIGHRKVDLVTPEDLSPYFRDEAIGEAEEIYAEGGP